MRTHVEIEIDLQLQNGESLHDVLRAFAKTSSGWVFPKEASEDYLKHHGSAAGFACSVSVPRIERASVALANLNPKHPNRFQVTNIIPAGTLHLNVEQYNAVGLKFAEDFRHFLRASQSQTRGQVKVTGPERGLPSIIPGAKCRAIFEAWLHSPTPTSHPGDVELLDRFICAAFRHQPKLNIYEIEQYLIEDQKWNAKDVAWAVRRIQTGLDVLRTNKRY